MSTCDEQQKLAVRILTEQARGALNDGPEAQKLAAAELKRALDLARAADTDAEAQRKLHEEAHRRSPMGYDHMVISAEARLRLQQA